MSTKINQITEEQFRQWITSANNTSIDNQTFKDLNKDVIKALQKSIKLDFNLAFGIENDEQHSSFKVRSMIHSKINEYFLQNIDDADTRMAEEEQDKIEIIGGVTYCVYVDIAVNHMYSALLQCSKNKENILFFDEDWFKNNPKFKKEELYFAFKESEFIDTLKLFELFSSLYAEYVVEFYNNIEFFNIVRGTMEFEDFELRDVRLASENYKFSYFVKSINFTNNEVELINYCSNPKFETSNKVVKFQELSGWTKTEIISICRKLKFEEIEQRIDNLSEKFGMK